MLDSNSTEIPMLLMALRIISAYSECSRYFAIRYTTAVKSPYKATNPQICKSCVMDYLDVLTRYAPDPPERDKVFRRALPRIARTRDRYCARYQRDIRPENARLSAPAAGEPLPASWSCAPAHKQ